MSKDSEIGRDLATKLAALTYSKTPSSIAWTHDEWISGEDVPTNPIVTISPENIAHTRQDRRKSTAGFTTGVEIRVTVIGKQQANTTVGSPNTNTELDGWLDFVDEIVDGIMNNDANGKWPVSIDFEQRYDRDELQTASVFFSSFTVTYQLV